MWIRRKSNFRCLLVSRRKSSLDVLADDAVSQQPVVCTIELCANVVWKQYGDDGGDSVDDSGGSTTTRTEQARTRVLFK